MTTTMNVPKVRITFMTCEACEATYMPPKAVDGPTVVSMMVMQRSSAIVILPTSSSFRALFVRQKSAKNTSISASTKMASGIILRN